MKKFMLLFSTFLIVLVLFAKPTKKGVHSISDFEQLYKNKTSPFNKISDTTFERLKSGIAFDDDDRFRGFSFIGGLRKELTFEEYQKFMELIMGQKMNYTEEDKIKYDKRRNL